MTFVFGNRDDIHNDVRLKNADILELDCLCGFFLVSHMDLGTTISYTSPNKVLHCQNFNTVVEELLKGCPTDSIVYLNQSCIGPIHKIVKDNSKKSSWYTRAKF